jgi:hypothetical protein
MGEILLEEGPGRLGEILRRPERPTRHAETLLNAALYLETLTLRVVALWRFRSYW